VPLGTSVYPLDVGYSTGRETPPHLPIEGGPGVNSYLLPHTVSAVFRNRVVRWWVCGGYVVGIWWGDKYCNWLPSGTSDLGPLVPTLLNNLAPVKRVEPSLLCCIRKTRPRSNTPDMPMNGPLERVGYA
jgi:hypothetical protein